MKFQLNYLMIVVVGAFMVMHLGLMCYFGQQVSSAADEITFASYECIWYSQPPSFTSSLKNLMSMSLKDVKIRVGTFDLSHATFCSVRQ